MKNDLLISALCILSLFPATVFAAGETAYLADTSITVNGVPLTILAGSTAQSVNVGATTLTVTAGTGNALTLRSTNADHMLQNDVGLAVCSRPNAELAITTGVVVISPAATGCPLPSAPQAVQGGGGSISSGYVNPTALFSRSENAVPLSFAVNGGALTTTNPLVTLNLNADPRTVRGYVVSLDPTFAGGSITSYSTTTPATFALPDRTGIYTIYFKYYSTTGVFSQLFRQTITYTNGSVVLPVNNPSSTAPTSSRPLFLRTLKLGSRGADVKALQVFLNTHGFLIDTQGVGSPGRESLVYGPLTAKAVSKFQEANASTVLVPFQLKRGTGVFGAATKNLVNRLKI